MKLMRFKPNHAWAAILSSTVLLGQAAAASELTPQQEEYLKEIAQRVEVLSQERSSLVAEYSCGCVQCEGELGKPLTQSGVDALYRDSGSVAITLSGKYYLEKDVVLPVGLTIGDQSLEVAVELCLNGNILSLEESATGSVITVGEHGTLTIYGGMGTTYGQWIENEVYVVSHEAPTEKNYDTFQGGAITGGTSSVGAGIRNQGVTVMHSGNITGNRTNQNGGGVYNSGTFDLHGGEIAYNHSDRNGGGIFNSSSGVLTLYGGVVAGNTATGDGGGVYNNRTFHFYSGLLIDNQGGNGGGVYNNHNLFMGNDKPTITCNYATGSGGGVFNGSLGTLELSVGSLISSNHSDSFGGGVFNADRATLSMNSGVIYSNQADISGGGAYNEGEIYLSGGTVWCNHGAEGSGIYQNGVFLLGTPEENQSTNPQPKTIATSEDFSDGIITIAYNDLFFPEGQVVKVAELPEESQIYVSMRKVGVFAENIPSVTASAFQSFDTEYQVEFDQADAKLKMVSRSLEELEESEELVVVPENEFILSQEPFTLEEMKTEFDVTLTDKNTFNDLPILENTTTEYFLGWVIDQKQVTAETVVKNSDEIVALWATRPEEASVVVAVELDFVVQSDEEVVADYLSILDLKGNLHLFADESGLLSEEVLPTLAVEGYVFEGWYVKSSDKNPSDTYVLVDENWVPSLGDVLYPSLTKIAEQSLEETQEESQEESQEENTEETVTGFKMTISDDLIDMVTVDVEHPEPGDKVVLTIIVPFDQELESITIVEESGEEVEVWASNLKTTYFFYQPESDVTITANWGVVEDDFEQLEEESQEENLMEEEWFDQYIDYVLKYDIMSLEEGEFSPKNETDRGTVAQALMNLSGADSKDYTLGNYFSDVVGTSYEAAAAWCMEQGIMSGYDSSTFGVSDGVTREQFAATITTFADWMGYNTTPKTETWEAFEDLMSISPWALSPFLWCVENDLVAGHDGVLNPKGNITRGEVAAILTTFHKNFPMSA